MKAYLAMGILNFGAVHGYMIGYEFQSIMLLFFAIGISAGMLRQLLGRFRVRGEKGNASLYGG